MGTTTTIKMEQALEKIYHDVRNPASFSSVRKLYNAAKPSFPELTLRYVTDWLSKQKSYSLLKPIRNKFRRNRVLVAGLNEEFQADLLDISNLKTSNKNYTFILTVVDVLSKYAYAIPLKRKTAAEVRRGFEIIFKDRVPSVVQTDDGNEFKGTLKQLFKAFNVMHIIANDAKVKCSIVERFNKTLGLKIARYLRYTSKSYFLDVLPDIVETYNNTPHRSIKMKPVDVTIDTQEKAFENLYGKKSYREMLLENYRKTTKLTIGDYVRKRTNKKTFGRGYQDNWSTQIFRINQIIRTGEKPMFRLADALNVSLQRKYYHEDLQKITPNKHYVTPTDRTRIRDGKEEMEVIYDSGSERVWIDISSVFDDA